jgi:hypothetical protein
MAKIVGLFHAALTDDGARAWLGETYRPTLWPEGLRVRFDPTELIDADGHVLARQGDTLHFAGGGFSAKVSSDFAKEGEWIMSLQSMPPPLAMPRR